MVVEIHKRTPTLHPRVNTEWAWLIEIRPLLHAGGAPVYYGSNEQGLGRTGDHLKAVRFARKIDAETMIEHMGWADAVAVEHGWG